MRNLSKVLALVLSLAFVMTMFAGAITTVPTLSDNDELSAAGQEAVAVLSALGIVNGYPEGDFKGGNAVTRAEFAKMITVAKTADPTAAFYNTTSLPFSDAVDTWAVPFVNYCYLNQIMVGYGNNTVKANGNVTGAEAIKMVLVALGYAPKVEGLEGSNWINNTIALASRIGLLKNLESENLYAAFDREANAILVYNAIYAKTVTYVGNSAVAKDVTLGEEVYDLLDVRGILVANDQAALGANWTNVLNYDGATSATVQYLDYLKPAASQSVFVYRDFTGASTVGGYYTPRAITAAIDSDFADLGRTFRVLTTGAKTPYNTTEVRKVYGVIGEVEANDYVSKTSTLDGLKVADGIAAMLKSAQKANASITDAAVQYNIFVNGKAVSYADGLKAFNANKKSTAPVRYVDNDNDGIWDSLFINVYTLGYVEKVTDEAYVIVGVGTIKKADVSGELDLAAGDYVAYYFDTDYKYLVELTTVTGTVTGVAANGDADTTYTIEGNKYQFGSLIDATDDAHYKQLMGVGSSAINAATLKYVMDGSWIVVVEATEETHWEHYGIFIGRNLSSVLGMPQIRLYTEDNEYKDFFVTSVNGSQVYDNIVDKNELAGIEANDLVKYYADGNYVAVFTADYALVSDQYSGDFDMYFNTTTQTWTGYNYATTGIQQGTPFTWKNSVVFVSVMAPIEDNVQFAPNAHKWRAYWYGEFQPQAGEEPFCTVTREGTKDQVVYASQLNGYNTLKAAAITFNDPEATLPGLVIREGQALWGTVMGVTSASYNVTEEGVTYYAYTVKILLPMSAGTKEVTVYNASPLNTFVVGDIYKMYSNEDGIVRRWERAIPAADSNDVLGTDYIELSKMAITGVLRNSNGTYTVATKDMTATNGVASFTVREFILAADADIYFAKNIWSTKIEAVDFVSFPAVGSIFGNVDGKQYTAYADYNPTTDVISTLWIDTAEVLPHEFKLNLNVTLVSYNEETRTATYSLANAGMITFEGNATTLSVVVDPDALLMNEGDTKIVPCTISLMNNGGYYVTAVATSFASNVKYDATNAQTVTWTAEKLSIYTAGTGTLSTKDYAINDETQIWWVRDNFTRVDAIMDVFGAGVNTADVKTNFYNPIADIAGTFGSANNAGSTVRYSYNPDTFANDETVDAYNYEYFTVLADAAGVAKIIVLHDTQLTEAAEAVFPYVPFVNLP